MFKQFLSLMLVALMINTIGLQFAFANSKEDKQARFTEKVKANIEKLGIGEAARVKIKLRDKTKLEGFISATDKDSFTVTNLKTGAATIVAYSNVKSAKGRNLSTGAKIAIGVGIAAAVIIFLIYYIVVVENDD